MLVRHPHAAAAAIVVAAGLVALPACDKKKDTGGDSSDPPPTGDTPGSGPGPGTAAPKGGLGLSRAMPAFRDSQMNLKQIGLAMHNYHDEMNRLPNAVVGPDGKTPGLSWRVLILRHIGQENLFRQFKLNEPWDGPTNKKLISAMPKIFAAPGGFGPSGYTYYRAFTGPGTMMPPGPGRAGQPLPGMRFTGVTDGMSNTMMVAEAAESVIWTKPEELAFTPKGPLPKLGGIFREGANVLMGDGSYRFLSANTAPNVLRALITAQGGEVIDVP